MVQKIVSIFASHSVLVDTYFIHVEIKRDESMPRNEQFEEYVKEEFAKAKSSHDELKDERGDGP